MKTALWSLPILIGAAVMLSPVELRASDPVGVYCIVEKVVMEASETNPSRIQVWGAFALSDGKSGFGYLPPQYGYMYFSVAPGKDQMTRAEWADLKKIAGSGEFVAFGGRYAANGRIRKATDKPEAPDAYPVELGVTRLRTMRETATWPYDGIAATAAQMKAMLKARLESSKGGRGK
jgi:hypothetical protein